MANVHVDGDDVVVELTAFEKAESVHGDVRVPRSSVRAAVVVDDPIHEVRGWKVVGARLQGSFAIGTFSGSDGRIFAVVHHGTPRGVRLTLEGAGYDLLLVGCDDPEGVVSALGATP